MAPYQNTRSRKTEQVHTLAASADTRPVEVSSSGGAEEGSGEVTALPPPWSCEPGMSEAGSLPNTFEPQLSGAASVGNTWDRMQRSDEGGSSRSFGMVTGPPVTFEGDAGPPDTRGLPLSSDGQSVTLRGCTFSWIKSDREGQWQIKSTRYGMDNAPLGLNWQNLPAPSQVDNAVATDAWERGLRPLCGRGVLEDLRWLSQGFVNLLRPLDEHGLIEKRLEKRGIASELSDRELQTVVVSLMCIIQRTDLGGANCAALLSRVGDGAYVRWLSVQAALHSIPLAPAVRQTPGLTNEGPDPAEATRHLPDLTGLPFDAYGAVWIGTTKFSWIGSSPFGPWNIQRTAAERDAPIVSLPLQVDREEVEDESCQHVSSMAWGRGLRSADTSVDQRDLRSLDPISRAFLQTLRALEGEATASVLSEEDLQTAAVSLMCVITSRDPATAMELASLTTE